MTIDRPLPASGELTRMILLGFVSMNPMHGYGIRKALERREMDRWADVRHGSIYSGLSRLEDEGLVEVARSERTGGRPRRTLYRATAEGREELTRLLRKHLARPQLAGQAVDVALAGHLFLGREELAALLERRLERLREALQELGRAEERTGSPVPGVDAMIRDLFHHNRRRLECERDWTRRVLRRIREGRYDVAPEALARWGVDPPPGEDAGEDTAEGEPEGAGPKAAATEEAEDPPGEEGEPT